MIRKYFPHILLAPDDKGSAGGSSSSAEVSEQQTDKTANGAESTQSNDDAAYEAAAAAAIETVQASTTPDDEAKKESSDKDEESKGEIKLLNPTEGETNEDGSPKAKLDPNETPEQKVAREAKIAADLALSKAAANDDSKLPFNNHPRWKEVLAERDTARTEVSQYRQQYEAARPVIEAHKSVVDFLQASGINDQAYKETLQLRALMNTDPEKALAQLMPIVTSLEAVVGKGIATDLLQKVKDGVLDEDSAKEITKLRAQTKQRDLTTQNHQQEQQRQVVTQMEQSVNSWFSSKKTADPAFDNKVDLINGQFSTLVQQAPPKSSIEVTALLEKAYTIVNEKLAKFQPTPKKIKPPLNSNASRTVPKEPENIDDFAAEAIDRLLVTH